MLRFLKKAVKFPFTKVEFGAKTRRILVVAVVAVVASSPVLGGVINSLQKDIVDSINNHSRFAEAYNQVSSCTYDSGEVSTSSMITNQIVPPLTSPVNSSLTTLGNSGQFNIPFPYRVAGKNYNSLYTANYGTSLQVSFDKDVNNNPDDYFSFDNEETPQESIAEKVDSVYYTANPLPNGGYVQDGPMQYQTVGTTPNREFVMQWQLKAANIKPGVNDDTFYIKRAQPTILEVQTNDLKTSSNPLILSIVTAPTKGTAVVSGQKVTYTPSGNSYGTDFFEYTLTDTITGLVSKRARADVNLSFVQLYDNILTTSSTVNTINVLANDYVYFSSDPVLVELISAPSYGTTVVNPDNTITHDSTGSPYAFGYPITANFVYRVTDKNGETETANVELSYSNTDVSYNEEIATDFTPWDLGSHNHEIILNSNLPKTVNILNRQDFWSDPSTAEVSFNGANFYENDNFRVDVDSSNNLVIFSKDKFGYLDGFFDIPITIKIKPLSPAYGTTNYSRNTTFSIGVLNETKSTHQLVLQENNNNIRLNQVGQKSYSNFTEVFTSFEPKTMTANQTSPTLPMEISINDMSFVDTYAESGSNFNIGAINYYEPKNCTPTGVDDNYSVLNNQTTNLNPTSNDEDFEFSRSSVDSPLKVINIINQPMHGSVNVLPNGTVNFVPNPGFIGSDTFEYEFEDTWVGDSGVSAKTGTAVVTLDIQDTISNTNPTANNDTATTTEDQSITIDVLANDSDLESSTLTICPSSLTNPQNGAVSIINNQVVYTPQNNFFGSNSFTYKACDSDNGQSNAATVNLTITPVNDLPIANNDTASTAEDQSITIDVLANDSDLESSTLTICPTSVTNPTSGLVFISNNKINYLPNPNFFGTDSFTYKACDSDNAESNIATVNLTVTSVNDLPVANNDTAITSANAAITVDVLANDSDLESSTLTICPSSVTNPQNGATSIVANKILYTPNPNFFGTDSFTYKACDGDGGQSNTATVEITVNNIITPPVLNNPPVANTDSAVTNNFSPITIDVLANDTDSESQIDPTSVTIVTQPIHGAVSVNPTSGVVTYTPTPNQNINNNLTDVFRYRFFDIMGAESNIADVNVNITYNNLPPTLQPQTITAFPGQTKTFNMLEETDPDNHLPVSFKLQNLPSDLTCNLVNKLVTCSVQASEVPGQKVFQIVPIDNKGLEGSPVDFKVIVEELITKTSIIKDKLDDQIFVGSKVGFEVGVTNANNETIENIVTKVEVDPRLLRLNKDSIKNGQIQKIALADKLYNLFSLNVSAAEVIPTFEIVNDNTFLIKIPKMEPNQTIYFNFESESLIKGKTIVKADTQVLDLNVKKSFAAVELPIEIIDVPVTVAPQVVELVRSGLLDVDNSIVFYSIFGTLVILVLILLVVISLGKGFKIK